MAKSNADKYTDEEMDRFAERNEKFIFSMLKQGGVNARSYPIHSGGSDRLRDVPVDAKCGIYVFYVTETRNNPEMKLPIYVGQTRERFKSRFAQHDAISKALELWTRMYLSVFIVETPHPVACFMESFLLEQFNFCLNVTYNDSERTELDKNNVCPKKISADLTRTSWTELINSIKTMNTEFRKHCK